MNYVHISHVLSTEEHRQHHLLVNTCLPQEVSIVVRNW